MAKNLIITGTGGQIGRAFVSHVSQKAGFNIFACDKEPQSPFDSANVTTVELDITDESQVSMFFDSIDCVDVLINNAGIGTFTPFEQRTVEEFMSVVDVNMKGTFLMCREAIKKMKVSGSGKIVNVGSVYGVVSSDYRIYGDSKRNNSEVYSMTKAAVIMLTKYLAAHYAKYNIQVNAISPGGVMRSQTKDFLSNYSNRTPAGRLAKESDLLPALEYLISDENVYTNGHNLVVDGGLTAW